MGRRPITGRGNEASRPLWLWGYEVPRPPGVEGVESVEGVEGSTSRARARYRYLCRSRLEIIEPGTKTPAHPRIVIPTEEPPRGDEWRNPLKGEAPGLPQRLSKDPRGSLDSLRSLEMTEVGGSPPTW